MRNPFRKNKPHILKLYNWNRTLTEAHTTKEDFDSTFAGYNVVYDVDNGKVFAPFVIGDRTVMVVRDDKNGQKDSMS